MRDIGTGDKSASSGRTHSRESTHKHKEESSSSIEDEEGGLLRDRLFVTLHLRLGIGICHF
jgi:hypothetical protein